MNSLRRGFRELDDLDGEVVAAKAVDEEFGFGELELRDDVFLYCRCRCCCERDDWRGSESGEEVAESAVVGAKVVTPGRDAVGFVDGDEGGASFLRASRGSWGRACARVR